MGKRHNRVYPGHFATQQGTPFYPAGMSTTDVLLRKKEIIIFCVYSPSLHAMLYYLLRF